MEGTVDNSGIKDRLSSLTAAQRELLSNRLTRRGKGEGVAFELGSTPDALTQEPPRRIDVDAEGSQTAIYPATNAQQRMWFLHEYRPDSAVYNSPSAFHLRGPLQAAALESAFDLVIRRHDALRTTFAFEAGDLVQRIAQGSQFELQRMNAALEPAADRRAWAERCMQEAACLPFQLVNNPPFRALLFSIEPDEHLLLVVMHHIVTDGWSVSNLWRELSISYTAIVEGASVGLPALPVQFADYATWERRRLTGKGFEKQATYWRNKLAGDIEPLDLPVDHPRPATESFRGAECLLEIEEPLLSALKKLAMEGQATLFMLLLAAFQALLHRYSGQTDLSVGVPIANRQRPEVEGLIGLFTNTLVMRATVSGDMPFAEFLQQVKATAMEAYERQDMPLEQLVRLLEVRRDASRSPLFQASFALQDFPGVSLNLKGIEATPAPVSTRSSKFDLSLAVRPTSHGLTSTLEFNSDIIEPARAQRMLGHWKAVLAEVAGNPAQRIGEISLLSPEERYRLLVEWNRTERDYPKDECIHELFEEQARRTPDAIAISCQGKSLTYHELDTRSNQLAHALRKLGVKPKMRIGVCLRRSEEMLVALLGVLKTGSSYVPLDPAFPPGRMALILEDSEIRLLLTERSLLSLCADFAGDRILLDEWIPSEDFEVPNWKAAASNAAYVMFTSGSTGRPKGVVIEHRSAVNLLHCVQEQMSIQSQDVLLAFASFCFDISVSEFFVPLMVGARVVIAPDDLRGNSAALASLIEDSGATVFQATPSTWQMLVQAGWKGTRGLKAMTAGETLSPQLAEEILDRCSELWNLYGPTETTIYATATRISRGDAITIGKPVANTVCYVVDGHEQLVPIGVHGELWIGGQGVARGYIKRADLTEERFISNPFSSNPGDRVYKSGDLVRWRADGNIEFLGRIDSQVKIRGFRVELGEIQTVLAKHPEVSGCMVTAADSKSGKTLTAFVVARDGAQLSANSMRLWLGQTLPDYMIPARFVSLPALPVNPNGKVDLSALKALEGDELDTGTNYVFPRNQREHELAEIWQDVLGRQKVGVRDNFFDLGGHSLLAIHLSMRIASVLDVEMPLRLLLEHPTIEGLAKVVQSSGENADALLRADRNEPLPMAFGQQQMWLLQQTVTDPATYNQPVAWRLSGRVDKRRIRRALESVLDRHEILRTGLVRRGGELIQEIVASEDAILPWKEMDLRRIPPDRLEPALSRLLMEEARVSFDLAQPPLWRTTWIELDGEEQVLAFCFHHSIIDEWSLQLFFLEVEKLYANDGDVRDASLPRLPIQYSDYSVWQRSQLTGSRLGQLNEYWMDRLRDLPPLLDLPSDLPPRPQPSNRGGCYEFEISDFVVNRFREFARREQTTLFTVVLAAYQVWLYRYTGQGDLVVATPVANRERPELEPLLGYFLNTLPIRTHLDRNQNIFGVLRQVRESILDAFGHAQLPFEQIVALASKAGNLEQRVLSQVMFVMLEEDVAPIRLDPAQSRLLTVETGTSKNDLTLHLRAVGASFACRLQYSTDLFSAERAEAMAGHLTELFKSIAEDPQRSIGELKLLPEAESNRILFEWNRTERDYPRGECIHELFEEQAKRTPDAVAVSCEGKSLSYRELNARSNQLAHALRESGVEAEMRVGVCLERSLDMLVALLGVLKAGSAYVPLDPIFPPARIAMIVEDSEIRLLLTQRSLFALSADFPGDRILLDEWSPTEDFAVPLRKASATSVAYVMYTSGSTGRPKGVAIEHRSAVNLLRCVVELLEIQSKDVLLAFASMSFDISVPEFFAPLIAGASVVMAPEHIRRDAAALGVLIRDCRATIFQATPATWQTLVQTGWAGDKRLKALTAGEALVPQLAERLLDRCGKLWNLYGPTETTVYATGTLVGRNAKITIGRPLANVVCYVVDGNGQLVPADVPGELWIGGRGVARGYVKRPDLTGERFIPSPFSSNPEDRVYKSGDLVRWRADGNIEFLGRIDSQVKIRGFRIELEEIQTVLGKHPEVASCVVTAEEGPSGKSLTAFVVARDGEDLPLGLMRRWLGQTLPDYMIPSRFVTVRALPLNASGKVDLKALRKLDGAELDSDISYSAPHTQTEREIADIWQQVLNRPQLGVRDNFFELGGHSLLAIIACSRITALLGIEVPIRSLLEHPTVEGLASHLESPAGSLEAASRLERAERDKPLPMSFGQQQMWLLQQTFPAPAAYNLSVAFRFAPIVDREIVLRSLRTIQERHEILRTGLVRQESDLVQQIAPAEAAPLPWREIDLRAGQPANLELLIAEEASLPFDLAQPPLWRALWMELDGEDCVLAFTFHHSIMDDWSLQLFLHELEALYASEGDPLGANLPHLPIQFADYSVWQRSQLSGPLLKHLRDYWLEQFRNPLPTLELPADLNRPVQRTGQGAVHEFQLGEPLLIGFRELARQKNTTLFTVLLAAFQVWLYRCTAQDDLVVATPIVNRERAELQSLLGYFLNTVPIRAKLEESQGFFDVLKQTRETVLEAFSHARLPFEQLTQLAIKGNDREQQSLYRLMFILFEDPLAPLRLGQAKSRVLKMQTETNKNDLTLSMRVADGLLDCRFQYSTDLFSADRAASMARHLSELFRSIIEAPRIPIGELNMMPTADRNRILVEWNRTGQDFPIGKGIHELFEEQVRRTPDAVALRFASQELTYGQLSQRSNRLAHHLLSTGIPPKTRIGICIDRSLEMPVALLGILKTGGAYLPLDPSFPPARLAMILEDAEVPLLLTQRSLLQKCANFQGSRVLLDELDLAEGDGFVNATLPEVDFSSANAAYLMYTSGSTGLPKGVAIEHRSVVNLLHAMKSLLGIGARDVLLSATTISFDISVLELFLPLIVGGQTVVVPEDLRGDGAGLGVLMRESGATIFQATPTAWQLLMQAGWTGQKGLKALAGGEVLPARLANQILDRCAELWNLYGPTETTIWSTGTQIRRGEPVTIGRPFANTSVYVVDPHGLPVPTGLPGELWIGGTGVARSYHKRPSLTAERFVPDPFSSNPESRLYRTGDLVRWRSDGNIEFLGRLDLQVKIRGIRVELAEIEAVLLAQSNVRQAVVDVRPAVHGEMQLIAYLVESVKETHHDVQSLRASLAERLPDSMLPSAFVWLDGLPMTPNGKVDRKSLPSPEIRNDIPEGAVRQPLNLLEFELQRIWMRLFQREDIALNGNFFALGGHSLAAVQLATEIDKLLNHRLPIATLFQSPTIESLARRLMDENWVPAWSSLVPLQPHGSKPPLFFVHGIFGDVFAVLDLARALGPDQPCYGIQAIGLDGGAKRHKTVEEMAAHYSSEILSFQPHGPYYLAGYSLGGLLAYEVAQQLHRAGHQVALLALLDSQPISAIPWRFYGPAIAAHFPRRGLIHLRRWLKLPLARRKDYLIRRWRTFLHWMFEANRRNRTITSATSLNQRPSLVNDYFFAAALKYSLRSYPGPIDVFFSDAAILGLRRYWRYLVKGDVAFHRIAGEHGEILRLPKQVQMLASSLTEVLRHMQTNL